MTVLGFKLNLAGRQIDIEDLLGPAIDAGKKLAQGHHDVERFDRGADHLGKQWAKDQVVFSVEKDNLGGVGGEFAA